jgi:hypothetical protein
MQEEEEEMKNGVFFSEHQSVKTVSSIRNKVWTKIERLQFLSQTVFGPPVLCPG